LLDATIKQQLVKTEGLVFAVVICRVCRLVKALVCSYGLWAFIKSNNQSKPCVQSLTRGNIIVLTGLQVFCNIIQGDYLRVCSRFFSQSSMRDTHYSHQTSPCFFRFLA
jgi:hypothetical protein